MCVLIVAFGEHAEYDLVVAANRDEFHSRPTAPAEVWAEHPQLLAGRDLEAGGTWLGVDEKGRFAAVTNVRSAHPGAGNRSRGFLVPEFLKQHHMGPLDYAHSLNPRARDYAGVNLIVADHQGIGNWSNRDARPTALPAGLYGLSNGALDDEWPKLTRLKNAYQRVRHLNGEALAAALLEVLRDREQPADAMLPDTGVGLERERLLAPIFIDGGSYGTRCSTVVLRRPDGQMLFVERRYNADCAVTGESRYAVNASTIRRLAA